MTRLLFSYLDHDVAILTMMMYFLTILIIMYFFYDILFYKDTFLNFPTADVFLLCYSILQRLEKVLFEYGKENGSFTDW